MNIPEPIWGLIGVISVALSGGATELYRKTHQRIAVVEKRIDALELQVNKEFISKIDFNVAVEKIEQHMIRIENKLDRIR